MVGDNVWRSSHLNKPLTTFVTNSDEAFALVVLENNYERWMDMWSKNHMRDSEVPAKYTNAGVSLKDGRTRKYCGWSEDGVNRFNELNAEVGQSRLAFPKFDKQLLATWQANRRTRRSEDKENVQSNSSVVTPATDFPWDTAKATLQGSSEVVQQSVIEESADFGGSESDLGNDSDGDDG